MVRERLKQTLKLAQELGAIGKKVIEDELRVRFGETVAESARRAGPQTTSGQATGRRPVMPDIASAGAASATSAETSGAKAGAPGRPTAQHDEGHAQTAGQTSGHSHGHSHSHSHSHSHGHSHGQSSGQAAPPKAGQSAAPAQAARSTSGQSSGPSSGAKRIATVTAPPPRLGTPLPARTGPARPWIEQTVSGYPVVLFVKGRPGAPACGFSASMLELFEGLGHPYATVDVLADAEVRDDIKAYTQWPTIPQVFVRGEFLGGADIVKALAASGELKTKLEAPLPELEV